MKTLSNLLRRLKRPSAKSKKGSSLAFVMAIGAALVIWVMCIMPLMATTGTAAYKTIGSYGDYLASRSAIEFCKSELKKIVVTELPYTFAVTGTAKDGDFKAIRKYPKDPELDENGTYVETPTLEYAAVMDEINDVPENNSVSAVCLVVPGTTIYDITIKTYVNGKTNITYHAQFKPNGSLMIFPESYGHNQALPLSDFVLVDGWLGEHQMWKSNISLGGRYTGASVNSYTEELLPWKQPDGLSQYYANSGEYPAVFKKTANAAASSNISFEDPVPNERTNQVWVKPTAAAGSNKTPGSIWYVNQNGDIKVYMYTSNSSTNYALKDVDITGSCDVYLNGNKTNKVPTTPGTYQVSINYKGADYDTNANAVNVLPVMGLQMPNAINGSAAAKNHSLSEADKKASFSVTSVPVMEGDKIVGYTYTIQVNSNANDLMYCCVQQGSTDYDWTTSKSFSNLEAGKNYFFYVCRPASIVDGEFYNASPVVMVGMVVTPNYITGALSDGNYIILNDAMTKRLTKDGQLVNIGLNYGFLTLTNEDVTNFPVAVSGGKVTINNLGITGDVSATPNGTSFHHGGIYIPFVGHVGGHSCVEYYNDNCTLNGWSFSKNSTTTAYDVSASGDVYSLGVSITDREEYNQYKCNDGDPRSTTFNTTAYLNLGDSISVSGNGGTVRLIQIPSQPETIPGPSASYTLSSYDMAANSSAYTFVQEHLLVDGSAEHTHIVNKILANNQELNSDANPDLLNAGIYDLIIKAYTDETQQEINYAALENKLIVWKNTPNSDALNNAITVASLANDDMKIIVSVNGYTNKGVLYFGYKLKGADDATYQWFPADESGNSFTFRLDYGEYTFAVLDTGNLNFNSIMSNGFDFQTTPIPLTAEDLAGIKASDFLYSYTRGNNSNTVTWVKMPTDKNVHPGRVRLVFGVPGADDSIVWQDVWTDDCCYFGIVILASPYGDTSNALQIAPPVTITNFDGATTSMMRGSSLYFMDETTSISNKGNNVYLTTDLLVLNGNLSGNGEVSVEPYTVGAKHILMYIANPSGITGRNGTVYEGRSYYLVPKYTDISNLNSARVSSMKVDVEDVKQWTIDDVFPDINLDIAYANPTQLKHIISGKTAGWVGTDGILSGNGNDARQFRQFAVCVYMNGMSGTTSRSANRVLMASRGAIDVSSTLTITARYLSVDALRVNQLNGSKFYLKSLAKDSGIIDTIAKALSVKKYSSKTLQMDYERGMVFGSVSVPKQIVRYDYTDNNGVDLFGKPTVQPLMATYTAEEIKNSFPNKYYATFASVDRYINIEGSGVLNLVTNFGTKYYIYSNYIRIAPSITEINVYSDLDNDWFSLSDMKINSQERGYKDDYLSFFGDYSVESFGGTLLCIGDPRYPENSISLKYSKNQPAVTLSYGFYFIPASGSGNGTSVSALNDLGTPYNTQGKPWAVPITDLYTYSVYIKPDGTLSNAFVDTGLAGGNIVGLGGFIQGEVE